MRYAVVSRQDDASQKAKLRIIEAFTSEGYIYDEQEPELIISVGGDGTILEAYHQFQHRIHDGRFVGIHSGNLGFYTDWLLTEIEEFITAVISENFVEESFPLLKTSVVYEKREHVFYSLNEITISDYHRTLVLDIYINDHLFEHFRGTGICVSTPSGSTAYNKSLHGALITPTLPALQLTEIASINNSVYRTIGSPLVFSEHDQVKIVFKDYKDSIVFTNDHLAQRGALAEVPQELRVNIADERIVFARYRKTDFWQRVHRSFISGN